VFSDSNRIKIEDRKIDADLNDVELKRKIMNEFKNRMAAQRRILELVNSKRRTEELFGLSSKAIERWSSVNAIAGSSNLVELIKTASGKLFFLANKSQEQISEDYVTTSREIAEVTSAIAAELV
jgi:hypothetical protein